MAIELLKELISTPSISRDEAATATIIELWLAERGIETNRYGNNVLAYSVGFDPAVRKTLLLNSHHDTVRPAASYTRDPFAPTVEGDILYGLGSNDAGASVVGLMSAFVEWHNKPLNINLLLAITCEEEVMGEGGIRSLTEQLSCVDMALVGEPTQLDAAIGERGLVVLDCVARGVSGHAARNEGENALQKAVDDIVKLRTFEFEKRSELLGDIKLSTTMISAGTQHNVVPDECKFVVDIRTTDAYTNQQVVDILQQNMESQITPRSTRITASALSEDHPMLVAAKALGSTPYVSPTTSDMALMSYPSLKLGIGDSARSHTADEYICLSEVTEGVEFYKKYIEKLSQYYETME
ncbi:MAG: M20/M25/M40 family metallo-hydrolase [Rikenellaceae bacterium]